MALNTITITLRFIDLWIYYSVQEWTDPFDAALSSLKTDGNNAMVTGTFQHGMTRLWDRRLKNPVQVKTNTFLSYKRGMGWFSLWCLATFNKFQLYCGDQFYWWRKQEYQEKTSNLSQITDKLYHI